MGTNEYFLEEATKAARSVRNSNPDLNIGIITSPELYGDAEDIPLFTHVIEADEIYDDVRDKAYNLHLSPFERTLYLDTDTHVIADIVEVFSLLDRFDIALAHNPYRSICTLENVPESFPEFNGGVILYSGRIKEEFTRRWRRNIEKQVANGRPNETITYGEADRLSEIPFGRIHDQPPLRETIYNSDFKLATLPREYNFGNNDCLYAGGTVKILHCGSEPGSVSRHINEKEIPRVLVRSTGKIYHKDGAIIRYGLPLIHRIVAHPKSVSLLRYTGLFPFAKKLYKKVVG
ncbi:MAG: hypothetical protein ABEI13_00490 [Candidatus Paceibacteria bacterium]